ncbi:AGC kinase [Cyclospora cayetanensis]|uniref:non-specific serine/threonine protein kinase n=1 Tax=Cyclospora cayetanensis TaxID=88456 RepID=A0A1D3D004_9EIME|nr:AGC kinase [Cyclospora cayetanensis]
MLAIEAHICIIRVDQSDSNAQLSDLDFFPARDRAQSCLQMPSRETYCSVGFVDTLSFIMVVRHGSSGDGQQYTFDHFELERFLGNGNFSEVFEVTEKGTANTFALKVFNRNDVMRLNKVDDVRMERHAMLRLNDPGHPNIIRLLDTFKDEHRVCFLYELAEGGELWEYVKYAGIMDKAWALRIISQLVSAVEYLHSKNIVHRDLKRGFSWLYVEVLECIQAENLVLTRDGVLKLIDLGNAMDLDHPEVAAPGLGTYLPPMADTAGLRMSSRRAIRRPTFQHYVGTPQFMPPEAIKNQDSGKLRDLWSLGCTIYQILAGNPPFSGSTDYFILLRVYLAPEALPTAVFSTLCVALLRRPPSMQDQARLCMKLSRLRVPFPTVPDCWMQVEARSLEFPPDFDPFARDLVERLLVAEPAKRLGANGFEEIKSHPFFPPGCFDQSSLPRCLFPSLQELCIRNILKRFHVLLSDAMDKARQGKYMQQQSQTLKRSSDSLKAEQVEAPSGEACEIRSDLEAGTAPAGEHAFSSASKQRDGSGQGEHAAGCRSLSKGGFGSSDAYISVESIEELLDHVVPRAVREQPKAEMPPHVRILVERLEYFLRSQGSQFSRECTMADEWDLRHEACADSSDEGECEGNGDSQTSKRDTDIDVGGASS